MHHHLVLVGVQVHKAEEHRTAGLGRTRELVKNSFLVRMHYETESTQVLKVRLRFGEEYVNPRKPGVEHKGSILPSLLQELPKHAEVWIKMNICYHYY